MRYLARDDGKINVVALGILAFLVGIVYAMAFYLPPWSRNRMVITAMHEASYRGWNSSDEQLRSLIRKRTDSLWVVQDGNEIKPLIDDRTILIRREDGKVHIGISYTVLAQLPLTEDWREVTFENEVSATLDNPRVSKPREPGFWSFLGLE